MNINALMQQAQKMQWDLNKAQKELDAKLFEFDSAGGAIHLSIYGNKKIEKIDIDKDAIDPEDKEMLEDIIKIAINDALDVIEEENKKLQAKLTNGMRMPF